MMDADVDVDVRMYARMCSLYCHHPTGRDIW